MNKKGTEAATLNWIVASFLIVFIMAFYVIGVSGIAFEKAGEGIFSKVKVFIFGEDVEKADYFATRQMINFLNQPFEEKSVYDFIGGIKPDDKNQIGKFREISFLFISNMLENEKYSGWIRIAPDNYDPSLGLSPTNYFNYVYVFGPSKAFLNIKDLLDVDYDKKEINKCNPPNSKVGISQVLIFPDKKLILCMEKNG